MFSDKISAKVDTAISLSANKSQSIPLALIVLAGISLIATLVFLGIAPERCWLPLLLTLGFSIAGGTLWWRSHKAAELEGGSHTEIHDVTKGLRLVTDSRSLESPLAVQNLASLLTQICHREPLPEPDGMIDSAGNPQPDRKQEASAAVSYANQQAAIALQDTASIICNSSMDLSEPIGEAIEPTRAVIDHNIPLGN